MLNIQRTPRWLPLAAVGLGAFGALLRWGLYGLGVDEKGLLEPFHIFKILLWLTTIAALGLCLLVGQKRIKHRPQNREALGELLAAAGIALVVPELKPETGLMLEWVRFLTGILAAAGLAWGAWQRYRGREGSFLAFAPVCVFLAFDLVSRYRIWSSHPQALDYLFQLVGALSMMVFGYYRCIPKHHAARRRVALLGVYCCLVAVSAWELVPLYLGGAAWLFAEWNAPGEKL